MKENPSMASPRRRGVSRRGVFLAAAGTVPAIGAACAGPGGPAGTAAPRSTLRPDVTVQVMTGIGAEDQAYFEEVVGVWHAAHAQGPKVEWGTPGGNITQKVQALLAADTAPDVVALNPSQAVVFSARGQLLALDPYIRRDRYDLSDFFELAIVQYEWQGKKYGAARGMSNQSLYVNQNLFDKAGIPYPPTKVDAAGWDFDAFLKAADRITQRAGTTISQFGCMVGRGLRGGWGQWVWTNGAEMVSRDFRRCTLDDPRAVEALQFMQDLIYKYRVAPTPEEETAIGGSGMATFINSGKVGMRITPVAEISDHRRAQFRWDYAVNPKGKGKRLTTGGGVGWEVMGPTKHREEAWAVFQHLTSAESIKHMSVVWYPGRKSALAHLLKVDPELPPKSRHVGSDGQLIIHPNPLFPAWDELEREVISPELQPLWRNEKTARQVAEALVPKANAFLQAQPSTAGG
jgi:multiple sugar transport system substrate-binding protein